MKPEQVVVDWLYGYETPNEIEGVPVAFSTPHNMMRAPRNTEIHNTQINYITRSKDFSSIEEINAFLNPIMLNPNNMYKALDEANLSEEEIDHLAYLEIINEAYQSTGERAMRLVLQSLLYSHKPIDAYLWIANHLSKTPEEIFQMLSMAVETAELTLDKKKRKSEMGQFWNCHEFRPFMRAKANLADFLYSYNTSQEDIQQAIETMETLLEYDLQDHMGIRFLLMGIYSFHEVFDKMDALYQRFPIDHQNPLFLYPMAYKQYFTLGPSHESTKSFLSDAIQKNPYVITLVLDNENIPSYEGSFYHKHSLEEAFYFFNTNYDYFEPDDKMLLWLTEAFQTYMKSQQEGFS
ncbi:hypothetical protein LLG10_02400 [bacterium]|nr:hypothetical protein [bacterium]